MTSNLTPYNFSYSDNSPLFKYLPYRDGPTDSGWNLSFSDSSQSQWAPDLYFGTGTSSHSSTLVNALAEVYWTGTDIWVYGQAAQGAYSVQVDDESVLEGSGSTEDGLLFSQTGMQDGAHSLLFRVVRGEATVTGTTITVGMGEPGTVVQTRNISATVNENGNVTANPFFLTDGSDWQVGVPFETGSSGQVIYPRLLTAKQGATVTFYLNSTSAFAMYGSVDYNQGIYNVTVTPPPAFMSAQATQYNASSHWMELDQIKCLVTGMNRSLTYRVDVTNESDNFFDFANLVVFDTPPASSPSPASSAPGSSATTSLGHSTSRLSSHSLGTGAILGIAVGSVLVFLAVAAMLFVLIRWQRRKRQIDIEEEVDHLIVSPYRLSSGNFVPIDHCVAPGNEASRARFPHFSKGHATVPGLSTNRLGEVPASSQTDIRQYESSAPSMPSAPVQPPSGSHEVIHEEDAGPIPAVHPPAYNPAWTNNT